MEKNVGKNDKIIRYVVGAIAAYLGYAVNAWFYLVAVISIATAAVGFCGLYKVFGVNTCKVKVKKKK